MVGWTESVTQTEPSPPTEVGSVEEGVPLFGPGGPGAGEDVWTDLQAAGLCRKDQAVQAAEDADPSITLAGLEGEVDDLIRGQAPAHEVDAPGLGAVRRLIPYLVERYPHLGDPALFVDRHAGFPYGVPRVVLPHVVVEIGVTLCPGGAHAELVSGQAVVVRINGNGEQVEGAPFIPPDELPADTLRVIVVHPGADVDGAVVVKYTDLGVLSGFDAFNGFPLDEPRRWNGHGPGRFIQPAVDRNGPGALRRLHGGDGRRVGARLGERGIDGQREDGDQGENRRDKGFQMHICNGSFLRVVQIESKSFAFASSAMPIHRRRQSTAAMRHVRTVRQCDDGSHLILQTCMVKL